MRKRTRLVEDSGGVKGCDVARWFSLEVRRVLGELGCGDSGGQVVCVRDTLSRHWHRHYVSVSESEWLSVECCYAASCRTQR